MDIAWRACVDTYSLFVVMSPFCRSRQSQTIACPCGVKCTVNKDWFVLTVKCQQMIWVSFKQKLSQYLHYTMTLLIFFYHFIFFFLRFRNIAEMQWVLSEKLKPYSCCRLFTSNDTIKPWFGDLNILTFL